jgi:glycosyltransferase involved in cell wall biosynthesis
MKLLLLSRYGNLGASSRLRHYQFLPGLAQHGVDVNVVPLLGDDYLIDLYAGRPIKYFSVIRGYWRRIFALVSSKEFDLVWVEKEVFPWLPFLFDKFLLRKPFVVDYDDAWFHRYDLHSNKLVRMLLSRRIDGVMKAAAVVTVGNNYIYERAVQAGAKKIEVIPTVVDVAKYSLANFSDSEFVSIGWIGTPATVKYLDFLIGPLRQLSAFHSVKLKVIGASLRIDGVDVECIPWSEATEVESIREFDIGVMPLLDSEWERGKCGYKLIQYMACGIPVVASPVGVNKDIVKDGVNGYLAADESAWVRVLGNLIVDRALRKKLGSAGRDLVAREYSLQAVSKKIFNVLNSVS